ncbi:WXG100 family type VII secretion target [Streptomyces formicae]|uniref:Translation initiation factor IF-2 n=1 Tax=Streptomyces formicae TaxID=1616117 RepID=A0ABY3WTI8_9ACTN|nr:hypothetical protein [Streptomyces formicae]UNM15415.1 hypothetical protein J4032_31675 [Streptomyces formicae]
MAQKDGGGGGGRTDFSSMPHEKMLEWLDQASSSQVQAAADRLSAASFELGEIAQQLKFRPERVEWKGEGQQAFIDWGASLASATQRLSDYSDEASRWMSRAAGAIAEAQSSIPRYTTKEQAQANLDAAASAPNDPDSRTVGPKAQAELAAFALAKEKNRLDAAETMSRLGKNFEESSAQMRGLEVPTFQPPPERFVPKDSGFVSGGESDLNRSGTGSGSSAGSTYASPAHPGGGQDVSPVPRAAASSSVVAQPQEPVSMGIDSVQTLLPQTQQPPSLTPGGPPPTGRPDGGMPPVGVIPPLGAGGTNGPTTTGGRPVTGGLRPPTLPGTGPLGTGPGGVRTPRDSGIVGGRPVPQNPGRPASGMPRGTVIGGEGTHGRPLMGGGSGGGMHAPMGGQGVTGGRRLAYESGGMVGGRGVQQPGAVGARPFTPGGSGLIRGAASSESGARSGGQAGRAGAVPNARQGAIGDHDERGGARPNYLLEEEETWQQNSRRVVPPVID